MHKLFGVNFTERVICVLVVEWDADCAGMQLLPTSPLLRSCIYTAFSLYPTVAACCGVKNNIKSLWYIAQKF
jgi:hypothetical protein